MVLLRCLPHRNYGLLVVVMATCGWIASLTGDRCNYSIVTADNFVSQLIPNNNQPTNDIRIPYIQVGLESYQVPVYYASTHSWKIETNTPCLAYPASFHGRDRVWKLSKVFTFVALIMGGGATIYLWISTCCIFSKGSWRWAGLEITIACIFQALSFIWFQTGLCNEITNDTTTSDGSSSSSIINTTRTDAFFSALTTTTCKLSKGSKAAILATCIWFVTAFLICIYYPRPRDLDDDADGLILQQEDEDNHDESSSVTRSMVTTTTGIASTRNNKDFSSNRSLQSNNSHGSSRSIGDGSNRSLRSSTRSIRRTSGVEMT